MQRIQAYRLLIVCGALALSACTQEKVPSVADYMHDIDSAKAMLDLYKTDVVKYQTDARVINASAAMAKYSSSREFGSALSKCWSTKPATTAGTDHACVDAQGFKR